MIELHAEAPKIIVPLFARTLPELTAQAALRSVPTPLTWWSCAWTAAPAGLADGFGPGARCHNETAHRDHPHSSGRAVKST